jgi:hypothetical protein
MVHGLYVETKLVTKVYIIPFHVKGLAGSIMPEGLSGAYVSCYVGSNNYVDATRLALKKLADDGLHPEEILQPINEMEMSSWGDYLQTTWPDHLDSFPNSTEFELAIKSGRVIYSPFASYD